MRSRKHRTRRLKKSRRRRNNRRTIRLPMSRPSRIHRCTRSKSLSQSRSPMSEERLQKIISRAGVTSRRKAEKLMAEGRVTVNGKAVMELGSKADLDTDHIKVEA